MWVRHTDESHSTVSSISNLQAERGMQNVLGLQVRGPAVVEEQQKDSETGNKGQPSKMEEQGGDEAG